MSIDTPAADVQFLALLIDARAKTLELKPTSWNEARAFVGGFLELVRCNGFDLLVHEEAALDEEIDHAFMLDGVHFATAEFYNPSARAFIGNGVCFGRRTLSSQRGEDIADVAALPAYVYFLRPDQPDATGTIEVKPIKVPPR